MRNLDEWERAVVPLSLPGYSVAGIVERTGQPQRTVERILERLRERVERL